VKCTNELIDDARANIADASGRIYQARLLVEDGGEGLATGGSMLQLAKARLKNAIASVDAALRDIKEEMANLEAEPDPGPLFGGKRGRKGKGES